jgi:hypothetical protein
MISLHPSSWSTPQWIALVAALLAIIVILMMAWPRPGPDRVIVRVVDGATPISTVVVPLR